VPPETVLVRLTGSRLRRALGSLGRKRSYHTRKNLNFNHLMKSACDIMSLCRKFPQRPVGLEEAFGAGVSRREVLLQTAKRVGIEKGRKNDTRLILKHIVVLFGSYSGQAPFRQLRGSGAGPVLSESLRGLIDAMLRRK
jgi:hypothetical protein